MEFEGSWRILMKITWFSSYCVSKLVDLGVCNLESLIFLSSSYMLLFKLIFIHTNIHFSGFRFRFWPRMRLPAAGFRAACWPNCGWPGRSLWTRFRFRLLSRCSHVSSFGFQSLERKWGNWFWEIFTVLCDFMDFLEIFLKIFNFFV